MSLVPITLTYQEHKSVRSITCTWESSGSGDASGSTKAIAGQILGCVSIQPSSAPPAAAHDITFKGPSPYKHDHFAGMGTNLSSTTSVAFSPTFHSATSRTQAVPLAGKYNFCVKAAGSHNTGAFVLYYR